MTNPMMVTDDNITLINYCNRYLIYGGVIDAWMNLFAGGGRYDSLSDRVSSI